MKAFNNNAKKHYIFFDNVIIFPINTSTTPKKFCIPQIYPSNKVDKLSATTGVII